MEFVYNDGGRKDAGYKGDAGDCVTRAIAIATGKPYQEVYDSLIGVAQYHADHKRDRTARNLNRKGTSPRNGVHRKIYQAYLESLGWKWITTMKIGSGCKVHLKKEELPSGTIIVRVSKHVLTVIDGVVHDTFKDFRDGSRCVYGYFMKA